MLKFKLLYLVSILFLVGCGTLSNDFTQNTENTLSDEGGGFSQESDPTEDLLQEGIVEYEAGNNSRAIDLFTQVIEQEGDLETAYLWRGKSYVQVGEYHSALSDFQAVLSININNDMVYYWRGLARHRTNSLPLAISDYERSIELNPDEIGAYVELGTIYKEAERYDKALEILNTAYELAPDNTDVLFEYGWTLYFAERYNDAKDVAERFVELSPYIGSYALLGRNQYFLGEYDAARDNLTKVIEAYPPDQHDYSDYLMRGSSYEKLGEIELAMNDYERYLELDTSDSEMAKAACAQLNYLDSWNDIGTVNLWGFMFLPCTRFDHDAGNGDLFSDLMGLGSEYGGADYNNHQPNYVPTGRYYNPATHQYQSQYCYGCEQELAPSP